METFDLVVGGIHARITKTKAMLGLCPNFNKIDENLWVGGINNPKLLAEQNFKVVVDLRETEDSDYQNFLRNHGVEYVNFKIPDRYGAPPKILAQIVALINEKVGQNQKVIVHCNLGRGRSALTIAAYLVSRGMTPEEALETVKKGRSVTYLNRRQMQSLIKFAEWFQRRPTMKREKTPVV
ncbi:dual specificity protein phosphatase family protein [Candidatus Bathyarchaeota archaeon]|nr:dual specificity protein phosphatase family protein [Candidatus Bathyarchaeota archaeon]